MQPNHDVKQKHHSSIKSNAGNTPKYNLGFKPQSRNMSWDEPREQDYYHYENNHKQQSPLQSCPQPQMIENTRDLQQNSGRQNWKIRQLNLDIPITPVIKSV